MILCPWCGTNYEQFLSNCKNCGGPIPAPKEEPQEGPQLPPSAPRSISNNYVVKLMMSDGGAIAGFVLALIGAVFSILGMILTLGVVTVFVGIPFLLLGVGLLAGGAGLLIWRYQDKQRVVNVLRLGQAVLGEVMDIQENLNVSINNRNPWTIEYNFRVNGQSYPGKVTTLREPGAELQPGRSVYVLYLAEEPARSTIYPHP
jgi:hypothetical protein